MICAVFSVLNLSADYLSAINFVLFLPPFPELPQYAVTLHCRFLGSVGDDEQVENDVTVCLSHCNTEMKANKNIHTSTANRKCLSLN